jgi:hypothetical protein
VVAVAAVRQPHVDDRRVEEGAQVVEVAQDRGAGAVQLVHEPLQRNRARALEEAMHLDQTLEPVHLHRLPGSGAVRPRPHGRPDESSPPRIDPGEASGRGVAIRTFHHRATSGRALRLTDTAHCPWFVIEAHDARYRDLTMGTTLLETLERRLDEGPVAAVSLGVGRRAPPLRGRPSPLRERHARITHRAGRVHREGRPRAG